MSARSVDAVEAAGMGRVNRGFGSDNELKKGVTAWRRALRRFRSKVSLPSSQRLTFRNRLKRISMGATGFSLNWRRPTLCWTLM